MTKSELIEQVSEKLKLPNGKAEQIVNCVFDSMVTALQEGDGIEIRGFGSFTVREYKSYEGRNPRTGETVHVAPKRLPFFKVGKELRERINMLAEQASQAGSAPPRTAAPDEHRVADFGESPANQAQEYTSSPGASTQSHEAGSHGHLSPVSEPGSGWD